MTEDFTVKQRPSATPYLLGGAVLGGVGGYFVDKIPKSNFKGVTKAKYHSMDDILKEAKDTFTKDGIPKKLKDAASSIEEKRQEYYQYIRDNIKTAKFDDKVKTEGKEVSKKATELKKAYFDAINNIKTKITKSEIIIDGLDTAKSDEVHKASQKYLKEHLDEFAKFKDAKEAFNNACTALANKAKAENVSANKIVEGAANKKAELWNAIKGEAAKFKTANKKLNIAIGAASLAILALLFRPKSKD